MGTVMVGVLLVIAIVVPIDLPPYGELTFPIFTYQVELLAIVAVAFGLIYVYWVENIEDERGTRGGGRWWYRVHSTSPLARAA